MIAVQSGYDLAEEDGARRERARIREHLVRQVVAAQWACAAWVHGDLDFIETQYQYWDRYVPRVWMEAARSMVPAVDIVDEMLRGLT